MYTYTTAKELKMFSNAKNTPAYAKLSFNKKLELFKLVVAFNVTTRNAQGKLLFPQQQKCAFVSGDFAFEDLSKQLANAQAVCRTNNIKLVD
jgi:hypothetical protein